MLVGTSPETPFPVRTSLLRLVKLDSKPLKLPTRDGFSMKTSSSRVEAKEGGKSGSEIREWLKHL